MSSVGSGFGSRFEPEPNRNLASTFQFNSFIVQELPNRSSTYNIRYPFSQSLRQLLAKFVLYQFTKHVAL